VFFGGTDDVRFAAIAALAMTVVSMILLVACANLANMLLARGVARQREIGMRLALGASRSRVVRQLLTENVLLAMIGGMGGLLLSYWGGTLAWNVVDRLVQLVFLSERPFVASLTPDTRILAFAIALSLTTGLLFGLSPALKSSRRDLMTVLKEETSAMSERLRPTRSWLIAGQMAVSITFLICAGLLLRGLTYAQGADPGFESSRVYMALMSLGSNPDTAPALQQRIVDRLRQSPDVQEIALVDRYPYGGTWTPPMMVKDSNSPSGHRSARTLANYVSPSYFATMGIRIERGRTFSSQDEAGSPVAVVSESAARFLWPQDDPIGKRLTLDMNFKGQLADFEVIGVANDVRSANLSRIDPAYVYLPIRSGRSYNLLLRSGADIRQVSAAVADAIESTDRRLLPSAHVAKLNDGPFLRLQLALPGIIAPCVAALALVALILAAIGLYGVTSYIAAQRTREVGIRMALGATPANVRWLMIRQAMTPVMIGAAIGLAVAGGLSHLLQSALNMPSTPDFLFGVSAFDPATFAAVTMFAFTVAAVASYLPAHRATKADPLVVLRFE
jgi:putative ABC transport system permease protein